MGHRFDDCKHLRRFLVGSGRRPGGAVSIAYIHRNRHRRGDIHGSIVLGGGRRAWRNRDSGETPHVGKDREAVGKTRMIRRRVEVTPATRVWRVCQR